MPTITKRANGRWQAKIRLPGRPALSETFDTKAQAQAWGFAAEGKLKEQAKGIHRATLAEASKRYILEVCPTKRSGDNIAKRLKALVRMLPNRDMADLKTPDFVAFRERRLEEVSIATVRKELVVLRSFFETARREWHLIAVNPVSDVRKPPAPAHRERLMSDAERDAIAAALGLVEGSITTHSQQVAIAMLLALETGMRKGELLGLEWPRIHLEQRYCSLLETKNGDSRDVPLSTEAVRLLKRLAGIDPVQCFTVDNATMDTLFRRARDKCRIQGLHFHDTRATATTRLVKKLSPLELARMLGMRDVRTLLVYYRETASELAAKLG